MPSSVKSPSSVAALIETYSRLFHTVDHVIGELHARGLRVTPQVYLADEWMSPDHLPAVAVPFYLVHPRLIRLHTLHSQQEPREPDRPADSHTQFP